LLEHLLKKNTVDKEVQYVKKRQRELKKIEDNIEAISPLDILNEEQYNSATSKNKNNLVIASAGTGKTSTIIGRVFYLIKEKKYLPEEIILLTFTNKAGVEMKERLLKYFEKSIVEKIFAGTFHSYGKMLFERSSEQKYKLILENEIKTMFTDIYHSNINNYSIEAEKCLKPNTILQYYNLAKNIMSITDDSFFYDYLKNNIKIQDEQYIEFYCDIATIYEEDKRKYRLVDFTNYLEFLMNYFIENECNLKEIIVDEYQDTNKLQNDILNNMVKASENVSLFCVGDYDQSIYSFNGSNIKIIEEFPKKFLNSKVLFLEKNYRSSPSILKLSEKLISKNTRIFDKKLIPMIKKEYAEPCYYSFDYDHEEHNYIVNTILKSSYDLNDIAILFRGNKSGDDIELSLLANDIPTDRKDKSNFLQSKEAQFFLSFIKLKKELDIFSIINIFYSILSYNKAKRLYQDIKNTGNGFYSNESLQYISRRVASSHKISVDDFIDLINKLKNTNSPKQAFEIIYNSNYFNDSIQYSEKPISDKIINAMRSVFSNNNTFEKILLKENLSAGEDDKYGVKLMTVHASKGLEFKKVFIIHLSNEKFPNKKLISLGGSLEEERRLMYVAITRAKEVLYMTSSHKYGKNLHTNSIFIEECGIKKGN